MLVCHCDLKMKDLLVSNHDLQQQIGLDKVEVLLAPRVSRQLSLCSVLKQHNEPFASLVVGLLYRPTEAPASE
jgi:hypothetical protein